MRAWLAAVLLVPLAPGAAAAQAITSAGPDAVSVTLYRDPNRQGDRRIDRRYPQGLALVSETRRLHIPAGRSTLRFEGVAGGIFAESAIVRGLPAETREKNLDADLLSPRSLYDRALGRRVMIRRTDRATGKIVEGQAVIRSGAAGGMVVQTGDGVETLHCTGLPEAIVYPELPAGLSPRPTLSIEIESLVAADAELGLSYLAGGFDWQADYVVTMRSDGEGADLFAWITLASADVTSFVGATTQVVAGTIHREPRYDPAGYRPSQLALQCWPVGAPPPPPPPPPPPAPMPLMMYRSQEITVSAARRAVQEELGDLKLYRIADPVTVAAQSQKQVAMLARQSVPMALVYVGDVVNGGAANPALTLRARNRTDAGLGLPLPAGRVTVFEGDGRPVLAGETMVADKAIGEDVEFGLGPRPGVSARAEPIETRGSKRRYRLTVTNANPWSIRYEARFRLAPGARLKQVDAVLGRHDGRPMWQVEVPANGTAALRYTLQD